MSSASSSMLIKFGLSAVLRNANLIAKLLSEDKNTP